MPPMCLGLAYRLYWSKGDYSSDEYLFVFVTQTILTVITWLSHYRAFTGNPGFVKPWHFREEGKIYWVDGKVGEVPKNAGGLKIQPKVKVEYSRYVECPLCQCIKITCPEH